MRIEANGIGVNYELSGAEDATLVTLSHSLASSLRMWDWQMDALRDYRVLRYDTRGHGHTDAPAGDYSMEMLSDDLFALLDALSIERTHFVGLSMGGMVGQSAALADASRFLSLTLCDTSSRVPAQAAPMWEERIATARERGMEALAQGTIDRWFSADFQASHPGDIDKIRAIVLATPVAGYCGCAKAISRLDLTDRLSAVDRPTLIIVGEDDPGTPVSVHEAIRDRIAGSELVVLPKALHFSNVEQRAAFNRALADFLRAH